MMPSKLLIFILSVLLLLPGSVSAATVGQPLTVAEPGWVRIDNKDSSISYAGSWDLNFVYSGVYKDSLSVNTSAVNQKFTFNFTGTQFRLLTLTYTNRSSSVLVKIDGNSVGTYSENYPLLPYFLVFESPALQDKDHIVEVIGQTTGYMTLDAIDIFNPPDPDPDPDSDPDSDPDPGTGTGGTGGIVTPISTEPTDDQKTIIAKLIDILEDMISTIDSTADAIDSITFKDSFFSDYLGYVRYVLGDTFYLLFSSVVLISLGIGLFTTFLRGWQLIRSLLP